MAVCPVCPVRDDLIGPQAFLADARTLELLHVRVAFSLRVIQLTLHSVLLRGYWTRVSGVDVAEKRLLLDTHRGGGPIRGQIIHFALLTSFQ